MPRLNVEESVWTDPRFLQLCIALGNQHLAIGALVSAWKLAQAFWSPNERMIPLPRWRSANLPQALIDCDLAVVQEDFVYVRGTRENHAWLVKSFQGGKKGGDASAVKRKIIEENFNPQSTLFNPLSLSPPLSLSLSDSLSHSNSLSEEEKTSTKKTKKPKADASLKAHAFIARYCEVWKEKYKTNPPIGGKGAGIAKRLVKDLGVERALSLIEAYVEMPDQWFKTKRHDLVTFEQSLNAVVQYHDTGDSLTKGQARGEERMENFKRQMRAIEEGNI